MEPHTPTISREFVVVFPLDTPKERDVLLAINLGKIISLEGRGILLMISELADHSHFLFHFFTFSLFAS